MSVKNAKVSICIPAYNDPAGLERLMDSIVIQSYRDYEVIISDDSSDDSCRRLADRYKDNIEQLIYIKHESTGRPGDNWNAALERAGGSYIKMMLHDDFFTDEESLGTFVKMLDDNPDADLAFSGTWQVSPESRFSRHISDRDLEIISKDSKDLYLGNTIGAPSAVIIRDRGCRFDNKLRWLIDMDWYLKVLTSKGQGPGQMVCSKKPLVSIGISAGQMTNYCKSHKNLVRREYLRLMRVHKLYDKKIRLGYLFKRLRDPA
ncbi:glycosyltransferase family 2 protein [Butyrivibrio sp. MC2013]|uniref:glycosyltransferase family 2 protein n=1 Tax=Butyrivibrio sp. MC2013 TaxID=1280686 RepID=UPI0004282B77|nr:glycosyltransferase family 2 protein [Butyrivibrio sp. MC2013]